MFPSHDPVASTTAYIVLNSSVSFSAEFIEFFDSSGAIMQLAYGPSGDEQDFPFYILPGGNNEIIGCPIDKGMRLSLKSIDTAEVTSGQVAMNFYRKS